MMGAFAQLSQGHAVGLLMPLVHVRQMADVLLAITRAKTLQRLTRLGTRLTRALVLLNQAIQGRRRIVGETGQQAPNNTTLALTQITITKLAQELALRIDSAPPDRP